MAASSTRKALFDAMDVKVEDEIPKQIKNQQTLNPEEDRISLLPDNLIVNEILPRLKSIKYAIRTGALSKRWQHLWPLLPCLCFTDYVFWDYPKNRIPDFKLSVEKTLAQCQVKNLKKLRVRTSFDSFADSLIHFAISRKVQQLDLFVVYNFALEDDSFFINSHFTHLDIAYCLFNPAVSISWNNLTTLSISHTYVGQVLIANILSGSPSLVTLSLSDCHGYSLLNITSKSVKNLLVCGDGGHGYEYDNPDHIVKINAPYISSLRINGVFFGSKILLRDVSSLVKVDLNYTMLFGRKRELKRGAEEMLKGLILSLPHVKELKIGYHCYEAFSRLEANGFNSPSNLKVVEVRNRSSATDSTDLSDSSDDDSCVDDDIDWMERADRYGFSGPVVFVNPYFRW